MGIHKLDLFVIHRFHLSRAFVHLSLCFMTKALMAFLGSGKFSHVETRFKLESRERIMYGKTYGEELFL